MTSVTYQRQVEAERIYDEIINSTKPINIKFYILYIFNNKFLIFSD